MLLVYEREIALIRVIYILPQVPRPPSFVSFEAGSDKGIFSKQSGVMELEVCWADNPQVRGSKPRSAVSFKL